MHKKRGFLLHWASHSLNIHHGLTTWPNRSMMSSNKTTWRIPSKSFQHLVVVPLDLFKLPEGTRHLLKFRSRPPMELLKNEKHTAATPGRHFLVQLVVVPFQAPFFNSRTWKHILQKSVKMGISDFNSKEPAPSQADRWIFPPALENNLKAPRLLVPREPNKLRYLGISLKVEVYVFWWASLYNQG